MHASQRPSDSATPVGTERFANRFSDQKKAGFYRTAQGLVISNIGLGTYLGNLDEATELSLNEIGRISLRTQSPLFFDEYRRNRETGSFVLIDETNNNTVAAGMILGSAQ